MMQLSQQTLNTYIKSMARAIRAREAGFLRGRPQLLEQLDRQSDHELVTRFAWTLSITGGLVTFVGGPLLLTVTHGWCPVLLEECAWLLLKLAMAVMGATFALAVWLTLQSPTDD